MINELLTSTSYAAIDGINIRCPRCAAMMQAAEDDLSFTCTECHFPMVLREGTWRALPIERTTYYAEFIQDYEFIRSAEGRGSSDSSYYLSLPYAPRSSSNRNQWKIRAKTFRFLQKEIFPALPACPGESMRILDIGAGNCWLSYRMAQSGFRPVAIDLLVNEMDGLGAAKHYDTHLSEPFPRFQAESVRLPFCDDQFDAAIFNASFHYAENYERTLREVFRCLKPTGTVIIADSPWYSCPKYGEQMLAERSARFFSCFGRFSNSIRSQEFITDERLHQLATALGITWECHAPYYGLQWSFRPWLAKLKKRREPATFRIYVARKIA